MGSNPMNVSVRKVRESHPTSNKQLAKAGMTQAEEIRLSEIDCADNAVENNKRLNRDTIVFINAVTLR